MTTTDTTTDTRPYRYGFEVTREACDTLAAMRSHVQAIGRDWGQTSPEYAEAAESLARQVTTIFASPWAESTTVVRDGPLSLVVSGGLTYGVIWHGRKRTCTTDGCHGWIADDGHVTTWDRERAPILEHEHTPSYPITAAQPGSWSFHS